ncbi:protocadherin-9-like [Saccostrea cucullata]|uniref:protocadherin-9-like n=1 Tax=Saccostrea cuccullata TaxID=36930 RepID=UPI002ECFC630
MKSGNIKVCFFGTVLLACINFIFGQDVVYHLLEGDQLGRTVGNVAEAAKLIDIVGEGDFTHLRYSFLTTGTPHYTSFNIHNQSSLLTTNQAIDRETLCEFTNICFIKLNIAVQSLKTSFFKKVTVYVYIDDINDNPPVFDKPSIDLLISESVLVGTSITIDGARDADTSDIYSLQTYEVMPNNTPFEINFQKKLDGTSIVKLFVREALNREQRDNYLFNVVARDGGSPPLNGTLRVNITITDVNDNSPKFSQSTYYIEVKENVNLSTVILTIRATDLDDGKNGRVFYRLSPHQSETILTSFAVDNTTGDLTVIKPLKYVKGEKHVIIVEASDFGDQPLTSQALVNVTVQDVGNNPPSINLNLLSSDSLARVSEFASEGTVVAHIAVDDPDTGKNGDIYCNINTPAFKLQRLENKEFKVTVDQGLDRELYQQIHVTVFCRDDGSPFLNTSASFYVEIEDENDNAPVFDLSVYTAGIMENNNIGDVIVHVQATDGDQGKNADLQYNLSESNNGMFYIDEKSGIIRTSARLDRENTSSYSVVVIARDQGVPPLSGSATVIISVLDKNDNKPAFNQTRYTFSVDENAPAGSHVGILYATDNDEGENSVITFTGPDSVPFTIFPGGYIKTDRVLDREVQNRYEFIAEAKDNDHVTTTVVTINLNDKNDNNPVVTSPSHINNTIYVDKHTVVNKMVFVIRAYDMDSGINSNLIFEIVGRNDSGHFHLHPDKGQLFLKRSLEDNVGKSFRLDILVSDMGNPVLSTPATLNIRILSSNTAPLESKSSNIIIVAILVSVTIIISLAIIIVIVFIRRSDRQRRSKRPDNENFYKGVLENSATVFAAPSEESISEKKKKKGVSFSLENGVDKVSEVTSQGQEFTYDNDMEILEEEIVIEYPPMMAQQLVNNPPDLTRGCSPYIEQEVRTGSKASSPVQSRSSTPVSPELSPKSILRNKNATSPKEPSSPKWPPSTKPPSSPKWSSSATQTSASSTKQTTSSMLKQTFSTENLYTPQTMQGLHGGLPYSKTKSSSQPHLSTPPSSYQPPVPPRSGRGTKSFLPLMMTNGSLLLHSSRPVSPFEISV